MGREYYYLAASLPTILNQDSKLSITPEYFLKECERLLESNDFEIIKAIMAGQDDIKTSNSKVRVWKIFQQAFRNELVIHRAQRLKKDPSQYLRGTRSSDLTVLETIQQALNATNPLLAEKILDQRRWQFLEELFGAHTFDFEYILAYAIKMKIMERQQTLSSNKGQEIFEELNNMKMLQE